MVIEIRGLSIDPALRTRVTEHVTDALSRLAVEPVTAHVTFSDENGPKGGRDIRCAVTVRLPYRPHVHVEEAAETTRSAFEGAFAALERQLARYRERDREDKRHPKKYFVAKRLLGGEEAPGKAEGAVREEGAGPAPRAATPRRGGKGR